MQCPHCHQYLDHPVQALRLQRKKDGKCIECGKLLAGDDRAYTRCKTCRRHANEKAAERRAREAKCRAMELACS